jgi:hypothetical protein
MGNHVPEKLNWGSKEVSLMTERDKIYIFRDCGSREK